MIDLSKEKLELDYPCNWSYKLVVLQTTCVHTTVKEIVQKREHKIVKSKSSKKGKFESYNLELLVHNEDDRKLLFEILGKHDDIKMVI
ncbi:MULTISPECIES: HP0495 family protein [Arcobacteraceae]|uniref:DUF493 domain-containing protein n=1 Tax=Poseidonibacter parvus TaxID=1850254 RepID=A0A1P8KQN7_9BACT|nr:MULTISPECIES: DUF493 family protein [Arcobacteraceae]APW66833.1 DUF493 domain-containing protein [Poseidonibacter parvus]